MWLLFLSSVVSWWIAQTPPGAAWQNPALADCSGTSFAYSTVPAGSSTRVLVASTSAWSHPSEPWEFQSGTLEIFMWGLEHGPKLSLLNADNTSLLPGGAPFILPTSQQKLVFDFNVSIPSHLDFQVSSNTTATVLFSCAQFRAFFFNNTAAGVTTGVALTTAAALPPPPPPPLPPLTTTGKLVPVSSPQAEPQSSATAPSSLLNVKEWLVLGNALIFLLIWLVPARVRLPPRLALSKITRRSEGELWATNLSYFSVVGYLNPQDHEPPSPDLKGVHFCPFVGFYEGYHIFAVGQRIPLAGALEGQKISLNQKIDWLSGVCLAMERASAHSIELSVKPRDVWIDPLGQRAAVANYASGRTTSIRSLGKLLKYLFAKDEAYGDMSGFIDSCCSEDPPTLKEAKAALQYFASHQADKTASTRP